MNYHMKPSKFNQRHNVKTLPMVSIFLFLLASPAFTQTLLVTPDRGYRDDIFLNPGADSELTTFFSEDRSYSCVLIVREYDADIPKKFPIFSGNILQPDSSLVRGKLLGDLKPGIAYPTSLASKQSALRLSFIAEQTGPHKLGFLDAAVNGTAVPGTNVRCNDTTLYGGFNRFFADLAIVELSNNTDKDLRAYLTVIDFAGNALVSKQEKVVLAGRRADVIFSDLPEQRFGQILVLSDSSIGALTAYVAEYDMDDTGILTLKRERAMEQSTPLP